MGAGESVKFLAGSPSIRDLAALVVGYGMAINIVEVCLLFLFVSYLLVIASDIMSCLLLSSLDSLL